MNKVQTVLRLYQQISPRTPDFVDGSERRKLVVWLRDDVCALIENVIGRLTFRTHATWVLDNLAPGSQTPERQQIDSMREALVECARLQTKLAEVKGIGAQVAGLFPPRMHVQHQSVEISGSGVRRQNPVQELVDASALEFDQVAAIAKNPANDLISTNDYFGPWPEFITTADDQVLTRGDLVVSLNPELHAVGNFVVRAMFRRLDVLVTVLASVRGKVNRAIEATRRKYRAHTEAEEAWRAVRAALSSLKENLETGEDNQFRESCMILCQIYAAFHPSPKVDWLGLPPAVISRGVQTLQHRLTHFQNGEMFVRVVNAISDLDRLYQSDSSHSAAIEAAVAGGGLVIDEKLKKTFWEGKEVRADWARFRNDWNLLVAFTGKPGRSDDVSETDLFGDEVVAQSTMATTVGRLKSRLPASLGKLIVSGSTPRSYRLDLPRNRRQLFA